MLCFFFPKRDDRKKFIHSKYIERSFYIPEESTDQELQQVMKNRPPGEDEDELFNDSAEFLSFLQQRSLHGTSPSPVCLVEDCKVKLHHLCLFSQF